MTEARMRKATRAWGELIGLARGGFTKPGFEVFETLLAGWVLAPGRRSITAMIAAADPAGRRAHDAYTASSAPGGGRRRCRGCLVEVALAGNQTSVSLG